VKHFYYNRNFQDAVILNDWAIWYN